MFRPVNPVYLKRPLNSTWGYPIAPITMYLHFPIHDSRHNDLLLCFVDNCRYPYTFNTFTLQIYDILFTLSPFADKISSFQTDHRPATRLLKILHADECHCFKPKRPNERLGGYWGMAEIFVPASLVIAIYFLHL